jgi:hypothetical protein
MVRDFRRKLCQVYLLGWNVFRHKRKNCTWLVLMLDEAYELVWAVPRVALAIAPLLLLATSANWVHRYLFL